MAGRGPALTVARSYARAQSAVTVATFSSARIPHDCLIEEVPAEGSVVGGMRCMYLYVAASRP